MSKVIRKTWPRVRIVTISGAKFYRVDGRKKGTLGKQESFKTEKAALDRAAEMEGDFTKEGAAGLEMPAELRSQAFQADAMLKPY